MSNTRNGRGLSKTYWGQYKERERDYCEPDTDGRDGENGEENACCEAPEGTVAPEGTELHTLEIMPGWYRHTPYSAEVMPCRYEFECKGATISNVSHHIAGNNTDNQTSTNATGAVSEAAAAGDDLCADGYFGPLCG